MKPIKLLLLLAIVLCQTNATQAQTNTPTYYNVYSYIKVKPGMRADYLKLEQAWKKIHAARIKAGKMDSWQLMEVLSPDGSSCEYNYVTRNTFVGEDQLAGFYEDQYMPDNWTTQLTAAELDLVFRTDEIRTLVKNEVWETLDQTWATDHKNAKISVFNYFNFPEGKSSSDHVKVEKDIWKPVHEARIKDGKMKGWLLLRMDLPFGDAMPYQDATIDVYSDMRQYLAPFLLEEYFKKVHPGKTLAELLKETAAAVRLMKGELRMDIDGLN